ncbi:MAG: PCMD domain-containing protein [Muribaculaceae bacterium]|nr:PCMD domain-containing protein [Muribaculaceae bacterium]
MKKSFLSICLAATAALALNATDYQGNIVVNRNGQTYNSNVTVKVTEQGNGLNTLVLQVPLFGTMTMQDVPASTQNGITVYSAERDVQTTFGMMRTTVFARTVDGMMAANVAIPVQNATMWFNTVGDHFQLPNSDMEDWNSSYENEPNRWHGFKSAGGTFASTSAGIAKLGSSDDVRPGATGHSAALTAGSFFGIVANGTMTNGKLMAGSYSATSYDNHAEMNKANGTEDFYMPLYAKPDKFNVWLKYVQGKDNANYKANVSVKTFDGTYYQEPDGKVYTNLSGSIVGGQIAACDWTHFSFPFDYDSYAANGAATEAIFVTFSTNGNPGQGNADDAVYVDDMELVYLGNMTDLRYQGQTINGWDPAVTTYSMEIAGEPSLDDFTATIEGVSAVVTKSMEQNQDGSYRIAISVVSADLQNASCYIINATAPAAQVMRGDVDGNGYVSIDDVTALIDYLLSGNGSSINLLNADCDQSGNITIDDVTTLIDMLLSGNY